jgi:hypothetical protein
LVLLIPWYVIEQSSPSVLLVQSPSGTFGAADFEESIFNFY